MRVFQKQLSLFGVVLLLAGCNVPQQTSGETEDKEIVVNVEPTPVDVDVTVDVPEDEPPCSASDQGHKPKLYPGFHQ